MNVELEIKRKKAEMLRVQAAKAEQEVQIAERLEQIKNLENALKVQDAHVEKLTKEIKDLQSKE